MSVQAIPAGHHTITPYITVGDGDAALAFYQKAFGAKVTQAVPGEDGKLMHGEIQVGDSRIMLAGECREMGSLSPKTLGGRSAALMVYLEDVDAAVDRAVAAGAKLMQPVADQFYGDRMGGVEDPFGQVWFIATHIADYSDAELQRRSLEAQAKRAQTRH